tara:strand:+ start:400 stop:600 length:201 start_codon:yes stop_codon:yes gene_type:complete
MSDTKVNIFLMKPKNDDSINTSENSPSYLRFIKNNKLCEICGKREAKINLELKFGSHRECRICWDN